MEATASAGRAILAAVCLSLVVTLSAGVPAEADATRPTTSTSTFRLDPKKGRVEVNVRVKVTNRIPSRITVGPCPDAPARTCRTRTSFFVASFGYFSVQLGARGVRFSGPGVKGRIDRQNAFYTDYVVEFTPIYQGQARTFKASYYLPAAGPRSPNRTRLMQAYAHFCWHGQPTDRGSATAILPADSVPTTEYGAVTTKRTRKGVVLRSRRAGSIGHFYACTDSFKPARLVRTETVTSDGQTITVEGWPEDPEWSAVITSGVEETLPVLEEIAGTPIPGGDVVVRQVAAQALGKYAGDFNDKIGQIRVSETYDDPVLVAHELAHAWFNRTSIEDTWIMEGHAEWMAHQANHRACAAPSAYLGKVKPDIARWQYLAVDSSKREEAVVDYQYEAACTIVQRIEWLAGLDRMPDISKALLERTPKYGGSVRVRPPKPDWREWLDAVDELGLVPAGRGGMDGAEELLLAYGVAKPRELRGRAEARTRYHEMLNQAWGQYMPLVVRDLLDDWHFAKAMAALDLAERALAMAQTAGSESGEPILAAVGTALREARSVGDVREIKQQLAAEPEAHLQAAGLQP